MHREKQTNPCFALGVTCPSRYWREKRGIGGGEVEKKTLGRITGAGPVRCSQGTAGKLWAPLNPSTKLQLPGRLSLSTLWRKHSSSAPPLCTKCEVVKDIPYALLTCIRCNNQQSEVERQLYHLDSHPPSLSKILRPWCHPPQLTTAFKVPTKSTVHCFLTIFWMFPQIAPWTPEMPEVYSSLKFKLDSLKTRSLPK